MWKRLLQSIRETTQAKQRLADKKASICSLSLPEARERVGALLSDPDRSGEQEAVIAETTDDPRLTPLGPIIREFFARYDEVVYFASVVGRAQIRPCNELRRPGELPVPADDLSEFLRIGEDPEAHAVVVVRPGEETVYRVSADDPPDSPLQNSFPSIYHYLLYWLG